MCLQDLYNKRRNFAIIDGVLHWADEDGCNSMHAHDWLVGHKGMPEITFEKTVRGGVFTNYIVLYVGSNYAAVNVDELPSGVLQDVVDVACKMHGVSSMTIYNGTKVGEPGTVWGPIVDLGEFACR